MTTFGLQGVSVSLGGRTVLHDITVEVPPGSVVAVVGGDGAGKTTLVRALVGELPIDRGSVEAPDRVRIGYLPATSGSWAALTVRQNLDFVAGVYGMRGPALDRRREELLARADLTAAGDRPASQLSGGMRRKLGCCLAIVHRPQLLVLDEPSTGLDPVSRLDLWRLVCEAAADGTAVLMSTTYLDEAERAADLVVLDAGAVLTQGPVDQVLSGFVGAVTATSRPRRPQWAWRRGLVQHEYWPDARGVPADEHVVIPDLEDVVTAASLAHQQRVRA
jgi:ABC-2 type transport system ATP-binding protein